MKRHKFDIRNMSDPSFSGNVANHFISNEQSIEEFRLCKLSVFLVMNRLLKMTY